MASNTEVIEIEIVMDDGKTQKGFLNLEKAGQAFGKSIDKNVGGSLKETTGLSEELFGSALQNIAKFRVAMGAAAGVIAAAGAAYMAMQKVVESSKVAEEIKQINTQFDILAARSGVSASILATSISDIARGLVDMDDVLKVSNRALGSLEISASNLERTFEIARQASKAFGADTLEAYQALNDAVITGSTRQLRQLGIFVDSAEAAKVYGKEIGVAANFLNEAGKQQAIFNSISQKASDVYAGVSVAQEKNSDAAKKLSVSVNELSEATDILIDKTSGSAVANVNNFFVGIVDGITKIINPPAAPKTAEEALIRIQNETEELTQKLIRANQFIKENAGSIGSMGSQYGIAQTNVQNYTKWIAENNKEEERLITLMMHKKQALSIIDGAQASALEKEKLRSVDREALLKRQQQLEGERLAMELANSQARETMAVNQMVRDQEIDMQKKIIREQQLIALQTLEDTYTAAGLIKTEEYELAKKAIKDKYALMELSAEQRKLEKTKALNQAFSGMLAAGIAQGVQRITQSLIEGKGSFDNFAKIVMGIMGDMAIQLGMVFISSGIAVEALKALGGTAAVAAGIGLIAVGTILKAMSGGGGSSDAGGAIAAGGSQGTAMMMEAGGAPIAERQSPNTKIDVNIAGNVMDRRQTGLEIVEIIREQFDTQGGQSIIGLA